MKHLLFTFSFALCTAPFFRTTNFAVFNLTNLHTRFRTSRSKHGSNWSFSVEFPSPELRPMDVLSSLELEPRNMAELELAINAAIEANRAIAEDHIVHDNRPRPPRAPLPSDTPDSDFFEYGSAECTGSSHETPIFVDDDDAASTDSSETLRADSMPLSQDNHNNYTDEEEYEENEDGEADGDDDGDHDNDLDSVSSEDYESVRKKDDIILEQVNRINETMTIVAINLEAFEDHLNRGSISHNFSSTVESFNNLRTMVDKMNANIDELDLEARYLSASAGDGNTTAVRSRDMRMVERGLEASRRIVEIENGIRSLFDRQSADLQKKQRECERLETTGRYGNYPQPPFRAGPSVDACGPSVQVDMYPAGNSSSYNAYLQQQRAPSIHHHQVPSGAWGQMYGSRTRGGQVRGGQMRGRCWRDPHPSMHRGSMQQVRPTATRPKPQVFVERGQTRNVSSAPSFHLQNRGCPWCNVPRV